VSLEQADVWGGSFDDVSSHREDATPIVFDLVARASIGETDPDALAKSPAIGQAPPLRSCRPIASCTDASFSAVFRYAESDIRGLAGRSISFLPLSSPGGAPGFLALRRFTPADGWLGHFCRAGPACRFRRASPPRLIFVGWPIACMGTDQPGTLRGVRLLGFTPICDPHPAARGEPRGPILPWALPLAGFSDACLRT